MEMVSITSGIVHFYFPLFVHLNSIIYNDKEEMKKADNFVATFTPDIEPIIIK